MKRSLLIIASAIAALTACSKTETTELTERKEISFYPIENILTKANAAEPSKEIKLIGDMGVYARQADTKEEFFANTRFAEKGGNWGADPAQYYPSSKAIDFTVYSPYVKTEDGMKISHGNIEYAVPANMDFLYGAQIYTGKKDDQKPVDVLFKHAKSKVKFMVNSDLDNIYTIQNIKIESVKTTGTATVKYATATTASLQWSKTDAGAAMLFGKETSIKHNEKPVIYGEEALVIPEGKIGKIIISYTLNSKAFTKEFTVDKEWKSGKRYVFNVKFSTSEILFNPSVEDWVNETNEDLNIQEDQIK